MIQIDLRAEKFKNIIINEELVQLELISNNVKLIIHLPKQILEGLK